jgi:hypothetical protein
MMLAYNMLSQFSCLSRNLFVRQEIKRSINELPLGRITRYQFYKQCMNNIAIPHLPALEVFNRRMRNPGFPETKVGFYAQTE